MCSMLLDNEQVIIPLCRTVPLLTLYVDGAGRCTALHLARNGRGDCNAISWATWIVCGTVSTRHAKGASTIFVHVSHVPDHCARQQTLRMSE